MLECGEGCDGYSTSLHPLAEVLAAVSVFRKTLRSWLYGRRALCLYRMANACGVALFYFISGG